MSGFISRRRWLAERPYISAIAITLVLILWMASGAMQAKEAPKEHAKRVAPIAKVQVKAMSAQAVRNSVELYGRTEPNRVATLSAEIQGKITAVLAKRGSHVKKGQIIAKIAINDLDSQLNSSQALIKQREIEFQGAKSLNQKGYQGRAQLAQAFAALEAAKTDLKRLSVALEETVIRAPFAGILNDRYVEVGDYVGAGDKIALIVDLNPLVVRAYATENQISQLSVGQHASIRLLKHPSVSGNVRYIASVADNATNTFKIEVNIENNNGQLLAGLSGEIDVALEQVAAIKLSPALLSLDEQGNIGIKSVVDKKVVFTPINIVKTETDGIWLTGLGDNADVIVLGQGFVRAGDLVEALSAK